MDFQEVLNRRYSCRAFAGREVEGEKVERILEAGRIAPTAVNKQPVHIWAVSNRDTLEAIKGVTRSNYGAPLLLVVGCRPADAWVRRYDGNYLRRILKVFNCKAVVTRPLLETEWRPAK